MNPRRQAQKELEKSGYQFLRNGSNHEIYYNPDTKRMIPLKRHDFNENDLKYNVKEIKQNRRGWE